MKMIYPLMLSALLAGCSTPKPKEEKKAAELPKTLTEAINSDMRHPENKKRDIHRHPVETLRFFNVQPNMTVVEVSPGAGWYTEILAPYLVTEGKLILAVPPMTDAPYSIANDAKLKEILNRYPETKAKVEVKTFNLPKEVEIAPPESVDVVLTFRNVHNWMKDGSHNEAFKAFYKVLKPGGTLGVVEHREDPKKKQDPKAKSGYVREEEVIKMAQRAGFILVGRSGINANPKDTKNHPEGVWTLPPALKLGDKNREKYEAIGESDRMTLKFTKFK